MVTRDLTPEVQQFVREFAFSAGPARKRLQDQLHKREWTPADVEHLRTLLAEHKNEAIRLAATEMLGVARAVEGLQQLTQALREDDSRAVRVGAATAIGSIGSRDGIESLVAALAAPGDDNKAARFAAVAALGAIPGGAAPLAAACAALEGELKARALTVLGNTGDAGAEPAVRTALSSGDERVALAAARALRKLTRAGAVQPLSELLGDAARRPRIRARAAQELGELQDVAAASALTRALLADATPEIRSEAANALARIPDGARKVDEVVSWLERSTVQRGDVDAGQVARALAAPEPTGFPETGSLAAELVDAAIGRDARMNALLAALLICSCANSVTSAGGPLARERRVAVLTGGRRRVSGSQFACGAAVPAGGMFHPAEL